LLMNVGADNFIDALTMLDPLMLARLEEMARRQRQIEEAYRERDEQRRTELAEREEQRRTELIAPDEQPRYIYTARLPETIDTTMEQMVAQPAKTNGLKLHPEEPHFNSIAPISGENENICLEVLLHNYGHHSEVWMSPFLRKLSDALPRLADFERKAL